MVKCELSYKKILKVRIHFQMSSPKPATGTEYEDELCGFLLEATSR